MRDGAGADCTVGNGCGRLPQMGRVLDRSVVVRTSFGVGFGIADGRRMVRLMELPMKRPGPRLLRSMAFAIFATAVLAVAASAAEPRPWQVGMQPAATSVQERLSAFHGELLVIIFLISAFVMGLLLYVVVRFNQRRNPVPSRTTHNTWIEVVWTVIPILILV